MASWKKPGDSSKSATAVPAHIDASATYFTPSVPQEVRAAVPLLHELPALDVAALVALALDAATTGVAPESAYDAFVAPRTAQGPAWGVAFTGLQVMLGTAIRTRTKASVVEKDLTEMNVPATTVAALVESLKRERLALESSSLSNRPRFLKLEGLQWRVDVAISSSALLRVRACADMPLLNRHAPSRNFGRPFLL
jgi:hypothetical protein